MSWAAPFYRPAFGANEGPAPNYGWMAAAKIKRILAALEFADALLQIAAMPGGTHDATRNCFRLAHPKSKGF